MPIAQVRSGLNVALAILMPAKISQKIAAPNGRRANVLLTSAGAAPHLRASSKNARLAAQFLNWLLAAR
jgi:hypothetical protein